MAKTTRSARSSTTTRTLRAAQARVDGSPQSPAPTASTPPRGKRFYHPDAELLMRAIEQVDVAIQWDIVDLLTEHLLMEPTTGSLSARERRAISSLREAARWIGHSPSVKDYRALRDKQPDLNLMPDGSIRSILGNSGWNDCLERAHLDAVAEGEFVDWVMGARFSDEELEQAAIDVYRDLGRVPTSTAYIRWAKWPKVKARSGRRPMTSQPFERFGGIGATLVRLGLLTESDAAPTTARPIALAYTKDECRHAVRLVAEHLGHIPGRGEYAKARPLLIRDRKMAGELISLPYDSVIVKVYGRWAAVKEDAASDTPDVIAADAPQRAGCLRYSDAQILDWIRRAYDALGAKSLSLARYELWREQMIAEAREEGTELRIPTDTAVLKRFGTWNSAGVQALGDRFVSRRPPRKK